MPMCALAGSLSRGLVRLSYIRRVNESVTARRLGSIERVLVASPAYLRRAGRLQAPADLTSHAVIAGPMAADGWTFEKDGRRVALRLEGRLVVSANEGAVAAAVAGLGIAATGIIASRKELANGSLVRVLPDWQMGSVDVTPCFPPDTQQSPLPALWQST